MVRHWVPLLARPARPAVRLRGQLIAVKQLTNLEK